MKKMKFTILFLMVALYTCGQSPKVHRGDHLFQGDLEVEGTLTAPGFEGGGSTDTTNLDYRLDTTSVAVDDIKLDLADTDTIPYSQYPFRMGSQLTQDTAGCYVNYFMGGFYAHEDDDTITIVVLPDVISFGPGTPSVEVTIEYDDNPSFTSPTEICSITVTGTATDITSFTNNKVPPGNHIRGYIDATPSAANKASRVYVPMIFY